MFQIGINWHFPCHFLYFLGAFFVSNVTIAIFIAILHHMFILFLNTFNEHFCHFLTNFFYNNDTIHYPYSNNFFTHVSHYMIFSFFFKNFFSKLMRLHHTSARFWITPPRLFLCVCGRKGATCQCLNFD